MFRIWSFWGSRFLARIFSEFVAFRVSGSGLSAQGVGSRTSGLGIELQGVLSCGSFITLSFRSIPVEIPSFGQNQLPFTEGCLRVEGFDELLSMFGLLRDR